MLEKETQARVRAVNMPASFSCLFGSTVPSRHPKINLSPDFHSNPESLFSDYPQSDAAAGSFSFTKPRMRLCLPR